MERHLKSRDIGFFVVFDMGLHAASAFFVFHALHDRPKHRNGLEELFFAVYFNS